MKKNLTLAIAFLAIATISFAQIPQDSLLLHYPFNGNAQDESNNHLDGIVHGATLTSDRFANPNSAYYFDGINDYIEMPNDSLLKPELPISFSFWAKLESLHQLKNEFFSTSPEVDDHAGCEINTTSDNKGRVNINTGDNSGADAPSSRVTKTTDVNLSIGIWYHIVGIFIDSTNMEIYINGCQVEGEYSGSGGNLGYNDNPGTIGRAHEFLHYWGTIDDFCYYNKALNSKEVADLFTQRNCHEIIYDSIAVTDTLIIDIKLSTQQPDIMNRIKVYPNPTKDMITINTGLYLAMTDYSIKIINNLGSVVFEQQCNVPEIEINLSTFGPTGLYYFQIFDGNNQVIDTRKIILK